jgi:murein DD-endopeptidase MepM/ murein hydrolase activator NlpD
VKGNAKNTDLLAKIFIFAVNLKEMTSGITSRLTRKYRVQVVDEESLGTARSWNLRPLGLIIGGVLALLVVGGTTLMIARLTGIRAPGSAGPDEVEYREMLVQVDSLKKQIEAQNSFIESFRKGTGIEIKAPDQAALQNLSEGNAGDNGLSADFEEGDSHSHEEPANGMTEAETPQKGNNITANAAPSLARLNLVPPVDGKITQGFDHAGANEQHYGIDLVAVENSMIRAVAEGIVIFSEYSGQTGYVIGVMHPKYNLVSFYKHNSRVFKTTGSYVFAGEAIAVIGQSGRNQSGPHLHFELWYNGKPINPQDYIRF